MTHKITKLNVAIELLDSALLHFLDTKSYYSSIHLAGAAEEILGTYVVKNGGEASFENMKQATIEIIKLLDNAEMPPKGKEVGKMMNLSKNTTKHMNKGECEQVFFDPKEAAKEIIDRAITNYYHLMRCYPLEESPNMTRFNALDKGDSQS